jgi:hypothetical protein
MEARTSVLQMGHFFHSAEREHSLQMHMCRQGVKMMLAGLEIQIEHISPALHLNSFYAPYISWRVKARLLHWVISIVPAKNAIFLSICGPWGRRRNGRSGTLTAWFAARVTPPQLFYPPAAWQARRLFYHPMADWAPSCIFFRHIEHRLSPRLDLCY